MTGAPRTQVLHHHRRRVYRTALQALGADSGTPALAPDTVARLRTAPSAVGAVPANAGDSPDSPDVPQPGSSHFSGPDRAAPPSLVPRATQPADRVRPVEEMYA